MLKNTDELVFAELSRYMLRNVHPSIITARSLRKLYETHGIPFNVSTVQRLLSLYLHVYEVDCPVPVLRVFFNYTEDILRAGSVRSQFIRIFQEYGCTITEQDFIDSEPLYTRELIPTWTRRNRHE